MHDTKTLIPNHTSNCQPIKDILEEIQAAIILKRQVKNQEKITGNQLTTIFKIAREKGLSQKEIMLIIQSQFNKDIIHLTIYEASEVIQGLIK